MFLRKQFTGLNRLWLLALGGLLVTGPAAARDIKVAVTSKPIHSLVAAVMGDTGTPVLIVEGSASPHTFSLRPSSAQALYTADIVFRVSEALEPFTRKLAQSLPEKARLVDLAAAPDVKHWPPRSGATFAPHAEGTNVADGDSQHEDGQHEDRQHGDATEPANHHGANFDPHVWLDPVNAKAMVREIGKVLAAADPEHVAQYAAQAASVVAKLDALDRELESVLRPVQGRPFVVFHDAMQYFERRYGLNGAGSVTVSPEVQPSAKRLSEVRRRIQDLGAVCIFGEPFFQPRLLAAVTEGTAARAASLDPEGATLDPGADLYFTLMRHLAGSLATCLSGS